MWIQGVVIKQFDDPKLFTGSLRCVCIYGTLHQDYCTQEVVLSQRAAKCGVDIALYPGSFSQNEPGDEASVDIRLDVYVWRSGLDHNRGVSNRWNGIWNGTIKWKMEWNSEYIQLQLTSVTGAAQSKVQLLIVFLGVLSHHRSFTSKFGTAKCHASTYIQAWYCCQLIVRCSVIVVLQSQTLV